MILIPKVSKKRLHTAFQKALGDNPACRCQREGNETGSYGVTESYYKEGENVPFCRIVTHSARCFPSRVYVREDVAVFL